MAVFVRATPVVFASSSALASIRHSVTAIIHRFQTLRPDETRVRLPVTELNF